MFENVDEAPVDPIMSLPLLFQADTRSEKVNLGVGTYRTEEGKSWILPSVKKAEELLFQKEVSKDYAPIDGESTFIQQSLKLSFGEISNKIRGIQTLGGTGALSLGAVFLAAQGFSRIYISTPTWPNHETIFKRANLQIGFYPYYNHVLHGIDFENTLKFIEQIPEKSAIVLQVCCHNPSGFDFSVDQWKELSKIILKRHLFPFFDMAYQGFGKGLEEDSFPLRHFEQQGHEFFAAVSYAKNLGLYGERVGLLAFCLKQPEVLTKVVSQFKNLVRGTYSNPPIHGARIFENILSDEKLHQQWQQELEVMRTRLQAVRKIFSEKLSQKCPHIDFSYLNQQQGMFSFCGLNDEQALRMRHENGIYILANGRINVAGLNNRNMDYVVDVVGNIFS